MVDLSTIKRCGDISETHVIQAAKTRDDMRQLLMHAAKVSRPGEGCAKVLLAVARMAMSSSDWLEGELRADFQASGEKTDVDIKAVSGGVIERVFPTFTLDAPLDEIVRAVQLVPRMIVPLIMHTQSSDHVVFVSTEELFEDLPPDPVEIEGDAEEDFGSLNDDFGSLNIEVADAIPESEVEKPVLRGAHRPALEGDIHSRKTLHRMVAIGREALRSDVPPATKRGEPPMKAKAKSAPPKAKTKTVPPTKSKSTPPTEGETKPKPDDDFDGGWE